MSVLLRLRTAAFALFIAWTAVACAQAQRAPANATYEPEVGQPGKDVVWVPTPQAVVDRMRHDPAFIEAKPGPTSDVGRGGEVQSSINFTYLPPKLAQ